MVVGVAEGLILERAERDKGKLGGRAVATVLYLA